MKFKDIRVFASAIFLASLVACGGGGGSSASTPAATRTGAFVDSFVEGISYSTSTQSGKTNAVGEFKFAAGEAVTFSIGNVTFPPITATTTITPMDLFATVNANDRKVVNMLVLLQSLDADGNPGNGIKIPAGAAAAATTPINFDVPYATFAADPVVTNLISHSGSVTTAPVTDTAAKLHFQDTLTGAHGATKVNVAPGAVAGTAQTVRQDATVSLNGVGSSDANGDAITYSWSITSKPATSGATLIQGTTATPRFVADAAGDYTLSLVVTDGTLSSSASTVKITATAVVMVAPVALSAPGASPIVGAGNCTAVLAASNAVPAIVGADMQQVNDVLAASDANAYEIFKKLPSTFMWWLRNGAGSTTVSMANLTTAAHETTHSVHNVAASNLCGMTAYKYLLGGTFYTTDLTAGATAPYSIVSQTYPLATKPMRYNGYIAMSPFPAGNDARTLLDELTAYSTAARLAINMMNIPENGNFTSYMDGDLAGMVDFMLFFQSYVQAARLNAPATYTALQSANTKAYIQALWTFAEANLQQSVPFANAAPTATYAKPMYINSDVLAQIYSTAFLAELDALGITHKTAADWAGTLMP